MISSLRSAYDLAPGASALLANISTRGLVQPGNNVMVVGFITGGSAGSTKVILRAIGPSITGLPNRLADPTLQLFNSNGQLLEANDNWRNGPDQAEIAAIGIAPKNDLEASLLAIVPPGSYTAIVAGKNGGVGVGLVEVYDLR